LEPCRWAGAPIQSPFFAGLHHHRVSNFEVPDDQCTPLKAHHPKGGRIVTVQCLHDLKPPYLLVPLILLNPCSFRLADEQQVTARVDGNTGSFATFTQDPVYPLGGAQQILA